MAKSPLKSKPLRTPGQFLYEQIMETLERLWVYWLITLILLVFAVREWLQWKWSTPPNPLLISAIFGIALLASTWKTWIVIPKIRQLKLGRDGEKIVGQTLDELRKDDTQIFHDIPAKGFNLDHVVVHKSGMNRPGFIGVSIS